MAFHQASCIIIVLGMRMPGPIDTYMHGEEFTLYIYEFTNDIDIQAEASRRDI